MNAERSHDSDPFESLDVSSRDGFAIEVQRPAAAVVVLRVEGKLDLWTSLPLLDALLAAFHEHPKLIAVDLSDVLSMDDTGLRALEGASSHVEEGGVRCAVICRAGSALTDVLAQSDAPRGLKILESMDDALGPWLGEAGELPAGV